MEARVSTYIRYNLKAFLYKWEVCTDFKVRTGPYGDLECETVVASRHLSYDKACKLYALIHYMAIKNVNITNS